MSIFVDCESLYSQSRSCQAIRKITSKIFWNIEPLNCLYTLICLNASSGSRCEWKATRSVIESKMTNSYILLSFQESITGKCSKILGVRKSLQSVNFITLLFAKIDPAEHGFPKKAPGKVSTCKALPLKYVILNSWKCDLLVHGYKDELVSDKVGWSFCGKKIHQSCLEYLLICHWNLMIILIWCIKKLLRTHSNLKNVVLSVKEQMWCFNSNIFASQFDYSSTIRMFCGIYINHNMSKVHGTHLGISYSDSDFL